MTVIKLDRDFLLQELYRLRSMLDTVENEEANQKLLEIVQWVHHAPLDTAGSQFPRLRANRA